jgi:hypothetical protein
LRPASLVMMTKGEVPAPSAPPRRVSFCGKSKVEVPHDNEQAMKDSMQTHVVGNVETDDKKRGNVDEGDTPCEKQELAERKQERE